MTQSMAQDGHSSTRIEQHAKAAQVLKLRPPVAHVPRFSIGIALQPTSDSADVRTAENREADHSRIQIDAAGFSIGLLAVRSRAPASHVISPLLQCVLPSCVHTAPNDTVASHEAPARDRNPQQHDQRQRPASSPPADAAAAVPTCRRDRYCTISSASPPPAKPEADHEPISQARSK